MGRYEVQILDSFDNPTYFDGQCAAIYKQQPPTVNASRKPGEWQTYDLIFKHPSSMIKANLSSRRSLPFCTMAFWSTTLRFREVPRGFPVAYSAHADKLPIHLQNHGNPIRFRNIWVRENVQPLSGKSRMNLGSPLATSFEGHHGTRRQTLPLLSRDQARSLTFSANRVRRASQLSECSERVQVVVGVALSWYGSLRQVKINRPTIFRRLTSTRNTGRAMFGPAKVNHQVVRVRCRTRLELPVRVER